MTIAAPCAQRGGGVGLVGQQRVRREQPRSDVGDDGHAEARQLVDPAGAGEAAHHEVRRVHLEHERGVLADGLGVVGAGDPVGGADLAQPGTGRLQQRGDAEAVADLDELAAGDHHLPPLRRRERDQRERRGAVVRHVRGRGGGHRGEQRADRARPARAALAGGEVQLHVARARRDVQRGPGRVGQRGPPEVRVQQHPGGVEDGAERVAVRGSASSAASTTSAAASAPCRTACWAETTAAFTRSRPSRAVTSASRGSASTVSVRGTPRRGSTWQILRS